jgi:undecaprenyl-diphosphatase
MDLFQAIFLGILQGITEFLPVSSSGHLVLARSLVGRELETGITFEIVVHFGSFCSIVLYYRKLIAEILADLFTSFTPEGVKTGRYKTNANVKFCLFILISMIPAMIVGFTLKDKIEELFLNPFFVSCMLLVTGSLLFSTKFVKHPQKEVNGVRSLIMGIAQAFAIIPGISRAGSTISIGLFTGMNREEVANFSFLMVLPVLAGAMLLAMMDLMETGIETAAIISLIAGFFTSFAAGYLSLSYLVKLLKNAKFYYFSFYCWAVGIAGMIYFF